MNHVVCNRCHEEFLVDLFFSPGQGYFCDSCKFLPMQVITRGPSIDMTPRRNKGKKASPRIVFRREDFELEDDFLEYKALMEDKYDMPDAWEFACQSCFFEKGHGFNCCFFNYSTSSGQEKEKHELNFHFFLGAAVKCYCGWVAPKEFVDCRKRKREEFDIHSEAMRMLTRVGNYKDKMARLMRMMEETNSEFARWLDAEKANLTDEE